jgi:hypothetical protein
LIAKRYAAAVPLARRAAMLVALGTPARHDASRLIEALATAVGSKESSK